MNKRYPIGEFKLKEGIYQDDIEQWISEIEEAPQKLVVAVKGLAEEQLDYPYRPEGWTLRQVVHHLADAHMNGYIRFKVGLTEEIPIIKTYDEVSWAKLIDNSLPIDVSLNLLFSIHSRLVTLLKSLDRQELKRKVIHPDHGDMTIEQLIAVYAWHGKHHTAHITCFRETKKW